MAKSTPAPNNEFVVQLDHFCTDLSATDKRVEMIGAFNTIERQAGRVRDTATAYQSRYEAFCNAPA